VQRNVEGAVKLLLTASAEAERFLNRIFIGRPLPECYNRKNGGGGMVHGTDQTLVESLFSMLHA